MLGGMWRGKTLFWAVLLAMLTAALPVGATPARADAANASVKFNTIHLVRDGNSHKLTFQVEAWHAVPLSDVKEGEYPGKADFTLVGEATDVSFPTNEGAPTYTAYRAKKAQVYKFTNLTPLTVEAGNLKTDPANQLFNERFLLIIERKQGNITDPFGREVLNYGNRGPIGVVYEKNASTENRYQALQGIDNQQRHSVIDALTRAMNAGLPSQPLTVEGAGINANKDLLKRWFCNGDVKNVSIKVFTDKGKPPVAEVPPDLDCGRPPLRFKLIAAYGEGLPSLVIIDRIWFTFEAYQLNAVGTAELGRINNFYFVVSDKTDSDFVYSTRPERLKKGKRDYDGSSIVGRATAREDRDGGNLWHDIKALAARVQDFPEGDDSCSTAEGEQPVQQTGPSKSRTGDEKYSVNTQETLFDTERFKGGKEDVANLNRNCLNIKETGWLQYWGVTDLFLAEGFFEGGPCSLSFIFSGSIGKVFEKLITCMIEAIFKPIAEWAAGLAGQAAGISLAPQTQRLSFVIESKWYL